MSRKSKREILEHYAKQYLKATSAEKEKLLDEFQNLTGYHRKYAISLLNHPPEPVTGPMRRVRARHYSSQAQQAMIKLWQAANCICSKRLKPFVPELIEALERHQELQLEPQVRAELLEMSAATVDRILATARRHRRWLNLGTTKPGTLLKRQIPVRTYSDWNENKPGFVEVDLVAHCGSSTHGEYLNSLVLTDVATCWTECLPLPNKGQAAVSAGIDRVQKLLPFALLGLDSDNGSEFINGTLVRYCESNLITFTRCRPYRKNDQCFVEQKNYTVVRQAVGYWRLEGDQPLEILKALYRPLRLYVNFFQPCMKLTSKTRDGSKVTKRYDLAQTPYQRVMASPLVEEQRKERLRQQYESLNPVALLEQIQFFQQRIWDWARVRNTNEATITTE